MLKKVFLAAALVATFSGFSSFAGEQGPTNKEVMDIILSSLDQMSFSPNNDPTSVGLPYRTPLEQFSRALGTSHIEGYSTILLPTLGCFDGSQIGEPGVVSCSIYLIGQFEDKGPEWCKDQFADFGVCYWSTEGITIRLIKQNGKWILKSTVVDLALAG